MLKKFNEFNTTPTRVSFDTVKKNAKYYFKSLLNDNILQVQVDMIVEFLQRYLSGDKLVSLNKMREKMLTELYEVIDNFDIRMIDDLVQHTKKNQASWVVKGDYKIEMGDGDWFLYKK